MIKLFGKNDIIKFCDGLSNDEFRCKCSDKSCRVTLIDDLLIEAYRQFRFFLGGRLCVNCGYRCPAHNFEIGGKPLSQHQIGKAIDISLAGIDLPHDQIIRLAKKAGFTYCYIDEGKNFIHCDVR